MVEISWVQLPCYIVVSVPQPTPFFCTSSDLSILFLSLFFSFRRRCYVSPGVGHPYHILFSRFWLAIAFYNDLYYKKSLFDEEWELHLSKKPSCFFQFYILARHRNQESKKHMVGEGTRERWSRTLVITSKNWGDRELFN